MYCPKCRFEYEAQVTKCPDCDVYLVKELPPETKIKATAKKHSWNRLAQLSSLEEEDEKNYTWIQLARLNTEMMAEMVVEALRENDIPVVAYSGTGHFGITGQMGISSYRPVGGGYSIMVAEDYVLEANDIAALIVGEEWDDCRLVDFE